jgi:hypothetical protein
MAAVEEIIKLAAGVLVQQLSSPYRAAVERRIGGVVVCAALGGLAGLAGLGCGLASLWLWLSPRVGDAQAGLLCAVTLLVAAFLFGLGAMSFGRRAPRSPLAEVVNSKELLGMVEKHIPELVIAAAVGGLLLGILGRAKQTKPKQ